MAFLKSTCLSPRLCTCATSADKRFPPLFFPDSPFFPYSIRIMNWPFFKNCWKPSTVLNKLGLHFEKYWLGWEHVLNTMAVGNNKRCTMPQKGSELHLSCLSSHPLQVTQSPTLYIAPSRYLKYFLPRHLFCNRCTEFRRFLLTKVLIPVHPRGCVGTGQDFFHRSPLLYRYKLHTVQIKKSIRRGPTLNKHRTVLVKSTSAITRKRAHKSSWVYCRACRGTELPMLIYGAIGQVLIHVQ